jgi:glycine dehydrogenase subunit 1
MYHPHTKQDETIMLEAIGVDSLEDLFTDVPAQYRFPNLNLPPTLTEMEVVAEMEALAGRNQAVGELANFLGAGAYNHFIPAAVDAIVSRGEFLTAYTPYQPEVSQGTLQAIFEYQSMIAALTGMDVSNASHYDGATAIAEAVNMAYHNFRGKRKKILLPPSVHPHVCATVQTYIEGMDIQVVCDQSQVDVAAGPEALLPFIDEDTALVIVQYPDFFGRIYDFTALAEAVHSAGALLSIAVNPTALGLLKPPGEFGADIVTGEGQPLGIPLSYGGPYLGIFTTKDAYVRKMAGRLVGETVDSRGQRGYVLTLSTREQHIRRERATSNICTNQGLMALTAAAYLSLLGKHGLQQVARLCYDKAHYAAEKIAALPGYSLWSDKPFFHEFVVECPRPVAEINAYLLSHGMIGGFDLVEEYPALDRHMLLAVTEMNTRAQIDGLVEKLAEVAHG